MKKSNILIITVIIISSAAFSFILYSRLDQKNQREKELKEAKPVITYVSTIKPYKTKIVDTVLVSSTVISEENIDISSKVSGRINSFNLKEGDKIDKGGVIANIEKDDLDVQILQAEAQVDSARFNFELLQNGARQEEVNQSEIQINQSLANLEQAKINLTQSENDYQRTVKLFENEIAT